jgi:hypothetical protein
LSERYVHNHQQQSSLRRLSVRKLFYVFLLLLACGSASAQTYIQIQASSCIKDASGANLGSGSMVWQATNSKNEPIPFKNGVAQMTTTPITGTISVGTITSTLNVSDPAVTDPRIDYHVVILDNNSKKIANYNHVVPINDGANHFNFCSIPTGLSVPGTTITYVTGPPGPQGAPGTCSGRGAWSNVTAYSAFDCVTFTGSGLYQLFVALTSTTGDSPETSPSKWAALASGGNMFLPAGGMVFSGDVGTPKVIFGHDGSFGKVKFNIAGVDYFDILGGVGITTAVPFITSSQLKSTFNGTTAHNILPWLNAADYIAGTPGAQIDAACSDLAGATGTILVTGDVAAGDSNNLSNNCTMFDWRGGNMVDSGGSWASWKGGVSLKTRWTENVAGVQNLKALGLHSEAFTGGHNGVTYGGDASKSNYVTINSESAKRTAGQQINGIFESLNTSIGDTFGVNSVGFNWGGLVDGVGDEGGNNGAFRHIQGDGNGAAPVNVFKGTVTNISSNTLTIGSHINSFTIGEYRPLLITTPAKVYSVGTVTVTSGGATVTGSGTSWLSLCPGGVACTYTLKNTRLWFDLTHYDYTFGGVTNHYAQPVCGISTNTSLTLCSTKIDYNASAQTYSIFKGSTVTALVSPVPTMASTLQMTVDNATDYAVTDTLEQPVHWNFQANVVSIGCLVTFGPTGTCNGEITTNIGRVAGGIAHYLVGNWAIGQVVHPTSVVGRYIAIDNHLGSNSDGLGPFAEFNDDPTPQYPVRLFSIGRVGGVADLYYIRNGNYWQFANGPYAAIDGINGGAVFGYIPNIGFQDGYALTGSAYPNFRDAINAVHANNTTSRAFTSQYGGEFYYGFTAQNAMFGKNIKLQGGTGNIGQTTASIASPTWQIDGATGEGAFATVKISSGASITKRKSGSAALDFANLAAIGCSDLTIAVTGAVSGDPVKLGVPNASVPNGTATFTAWVSAADTVTVRYCNLVSGDPASGTFKVIVGD